MAWSNLAYEFIPTHWGCRWTIPLKGSRRRKKDWQKETIVISAH